MVGLLSRTLTKEKQDPDLVNGACLVALWLCGLLRDSSRFGKYFRMSVGYLNLVYEVFSGKMLRLVELRVVTDLFRFAKYLIHTKPA